MLTPPDGIPRGIFVWLVVPKNYSIEKNGIENYNRRTIQNNPSYGLYKID